MQQEKQDTQNKLLEWWKKIKGKKGLDTFLIVLIVVIIVVSILPAVIEIWRNKRKKK